ncbi:glycosyltransferase family 87 protein [Pandoraea pulmonicola]|uniref:Protein of uncharacterized function (DUF2029) n=1 Tax=Pandoraea pulmonicola TaxID=93221 RepID=A0AAJ4ZCG2_PANPU|nr:glycosyltransferase family 87 protein [Pandoraea pulmonicola]APD13292.1 hypothetical protein RO07_10030 [Pandoraea pulmonicola]SUA90760.1 Protein of uncharacterised function (DUF2029) [Pandoraea pulmonicola]
MKTSDTGGVVHARQPSGNEPRPQTAHWLTLERVRLYAAVALVCQVIVGICWIAHIHFDTTGKLDPLALDFLPFWSAAWMALQGHATDAYNVVALTRVEIMAEPAMAQVDGIMPWLYPPTVLLFILPLAWVPLRVAYLCFALAGLSLFAYAARRIAPWPQAVLPIVAFPAVGLVIAAGQAALSTAGLAGLVLVLLRRRPALAGICAGLLFMKPHLALLFPLAFLCSRAWTALAACLATVVLSVTASVVVFGPETVTAFLHGVQGAQAAVIAGRAQLFRMPSVFIMAHMMHAPLWLAWTLHGAVALWAAALVADAWLRCGAYALRAAILLSASLLMSPYVYDYDLAWFGILIAWLCVHGQAHGWRTGEREWLVLLWLTPLAGLLIVSFVGFQFMPFITIATLAGVRRRLRLDSPPGAACVMASAATPEGDGMHAVSP